jgi:hypothetical protein
MSSLSRTGYVLFQNIIIFIFTMYSIYPLNDFQEDENGERLLVFCELPFAEDRRELVFRSLIDKKHMPTDAQVGVYCT